MAPPRFIVFGAPASGKSTLLNYLPQHGYCTSIDLENVGGKEANYEVPLDQRNETLKRLCFLRALINVDFQKPLFVGSADIDAAAFPQGWKVIVLHHQNREGYLAWAKRRDEPRPDKSGQKYEEMHGHLTSYIERTGPSLIFDPSDYQNRPDDLAIEVWKKIDPDCKFRPR